MVLTNITNSTRGRDDCCLSEDDGESRRGLVGIWVLVVLVV